MNTYTPDNQFAIDATGKQWAIDTFYPMPIPAGIASELGNPVMYSGKKWAIGGPVTNHGALTQYSDAERLDWLQQHGGELSARGEEITAGSLGCFWLYVAFEDEFRGSTIRAAIDAAIRGTFAQPHTGEISTKGTPSPINGTTKQNT